jgi:hypothetical protein
LKVRKGLAALASGAILGVGLVLAGPTADAQAADTLACARVSDNSAGACMYHVGRERYQVKLWDNACDGHRAYAEYYFSVLGSHKFAPVTKCGHNYSSTFSHGEFDVKVRVCIEDWGPNTCSAWARSD